MSRRTLAVAAVAATALVSMFTAASASAAVTTAVSNGTLSISSDARGDQIFLVKDGTDLLVFVGPDGSDKRTFALDRFDAIQITGHGGDDRIAVSSLNGIFTDTESTAVSGGEGNDVVTGSRGPERLDGDIGDDELVGGDGVDRLNGGSDNDKLHGGFGIDTVDGGSGDDVIRHENADRSETVAGATGADTLQLVGSDNAEVLHIGESSTGLLAVLTSPRAYRVDSVGVEHATFDAGGGDDHLDTDVDSAASELSVAGGSGDDEVEGGPGADSLSGGDDNDILVGKAGADELAGGAGSDAFTCDGEDTLLDFQPGEVLTGCAGPVAPPADPEPPAPGPTPGAPGAPVAPPAEPAAPPTAGALARPRIALARKGLKVVLRSTHTTPVDVLVAATERRGRKLHRYRRVRRTIPAGGRVTVTLKAPRALVKQLRSRRRGKRRPTVTVTDLATGAKLTARR
jgi:Ca2+-binding RTX toxin-like protein